MWSHPYEIEVVKTSVFSKTLICVTTSPLKIESHEKILLVTSWTEIMTSQPLFQNNFISRKSRVAVIVNIDKIATMFIKITFKD